MPAKKKKYESLRQVPTDSEPEIEMSETSQSSFRNSSQTPSLISNPPVPEPSTSYGIFAFIDNLFLQFPAIKLSQIILTTLFLAFSDAIIVEFIKAKWKFKNYEYLREAVYFPSYGLLPVVALFISNVKMGKRHSLRIYNSMFSGAIFIASLTLVALQLKQHDLQVGVAVFMINLCRGGLLITVVTTVS